MTGPILLVRADPSETFGVGRASLTEAGADVRIWEAIDGEPAPPIDTVGGVVMFGSTFNVEHADEQPFIRALRDVTLAALDSSTPYLGICFGSQVLAWSLGARIEKAPVREFGYVALRITKEGVGDPVLGHYDDGDMVFQWHMDTFTLPDGATLLGTGDAVANQAYRVGDAAWATQFHLEVDRRELDAWLDEVHDTVERDWGRPADDIRAEADVHHDAHEARGAEVFRRFAAVVRERA